MNEQWGLPNASAGGEEALERIGAVASAAGAACCETMGALPNADGSSSARMIALSPIAGGMAAEQPASRAGVGGGAAALDAASGGAFAASVAADARALEAYAAALGGDADAAAAADAFVDAIDAIENSAGTVFTSGIGKSGIVAQRMAAALASLAVPSTFVHASEWAHGELGSLRAGRDAVVLFSNSGATKECVDVGREVSFLLCTVTFYANLAHSLTRSP